MGSPATTSNQTLATWEHRQADSGRLKRCYFCSKCGTRLLHHSEDSDHVAVKSKVVDGLTAEILSGATRIWTKHAVAPVPDGAERFEGEPDD